MNLETWLGKDNQLGQDIWAKKYQYKNETFDEWLDRVSNGNKDLRQLIADKKFLFGGRALANRGTNKDGSMFNCYSSGYCEDSIDKIMELNTNLALTYKAQGGQGVSLSKLRPKGTKVKESFESDGIVPFMELFNTTTSSISQGGARKGALMLSLDIRHKEAPTFITIKSNEDKITKANLSLEIDDEFMEAVQKYYKTGEIKIIHESRDYNGHLVEYDINPVELYKLMVKTVYDWGEPGCIFTGKFRNYNLMQYDDDYQIETANPCGEQPLPKDFSCNLGSINLSEFVSNPYTDLAKFELTDFIKAVQIGVEALDTIIDQNINRHALKSQADNSKNYRNIGLGVFGYANMLFKLGLTYGSKEAIDFTDKLFMTMFIAALWESNELAMKKGAFPKCKPEAIVKSDIFKRLKAGEELEKSILKYGLRNCSLLSIAPTGSIATMMGCSGGCEPEFALSYDRRTDNLKESYKVYCKSVREYCDITGASPENLPEYFITSSQINWRDRVITQGIMQKWVDTAISSTVNLPENTPIDEVEQIYLFAWEQGLKGLTIFRSNCKRLAILSTGSKSSTQPVDTSKEISRGTIINCSDDCIGKKRKLKTGCGSLHVLAFFDPTTYELQEVFLNKGSSGGCQGYMSGLGRMISLLARAGIDMNTIKDQLDSTIPCTAYCTRSATKHDTSKGTNCPMAIGNALVDMWQELISENYDPELDAAPPAVENAQQVKPDTEIISQSSESICPECGMPLVNEGGCNVCKNCGWSKCN